MALTLGELMGLVEQVFTSSRSLQILVIGGVYGVYMVGLVALLWIRIRRRSKE